MTDTTIPAPPPANDNTWAIVAYTRWFGLPTRYIEIKLICECCGATHYLEGECEWNQIPEITRKLMDEFEHRHWCTVKKE